MAKILILGGGFGGLSAATALRDALGDEHEIIVLDRREEFFIGLRKLWVLADIAPLSEGTRRMDRLTERGIDIRRTTITGIDPAARRVETADGSLEADYLIVALGAEPRADRVAGFGEHGYNLYDLADVERLAALLRETLPRHVVVSILGKPYKCPPAPYEAILLLEEAFRDRKVRDEVELTFTTFQPALLPNAGEEGHRRLAALFEERGITWHTGRKISRYEPERVVFEDGVIEGQVLIGVPPHRPPPVLAGSGLTGKGPWVQVDRETLATGYDRVFAIGDCVHIPLGEDVALPKAGVFAEAHAERVAAAIAADITGGPEPPAFDGVGQCWLEMGKDVAAFVEGSFYAPGGPDVRLADASREHAEAKRRFERERLERWFGS